MRTHLGETPESQCPECHRLFTDEPNREAIDALGCCLSCDAANGEAADIRAENADLQT